MDDSILKFCNAKKRILSMQFVEAQALSFLSGVDFVIF